MSISLTDINGVVISGNTTPNALRVISYTADGSKLFQNDRAAIVLGSTSSALISGANYKTSKLISSSQDSNLRIGKSIVLLNEVIDGFNSSGSSMTGFAGFSGGSFSATAGTGRQVLTTTDANAGGGFTSNIAWYFAPKVKYFYKCHANISAYGLQTIVVLGLSNVSSWTKRSDDSWIPVYVNGFGVNVYGSPVSKETFTSSIPLTDYGIFTILVEDTRITFSIYTVGEILVNEQIINIPNTAPSAYAYSFGVSETLSNTVATSATTTLNLAHTSLVISDINSYSWNQTLLASSKRSLALENYTKDTAPASATLSNTAAGYTTLGGLWRFAAVSGAETDYALFAYQVSSAIAFNCTRISISSINTGAANATTLTTLQWSAAFNSNAVSLATAAPQSPMKQTIGSHIFTLTAAIGAFGGNAAVWNGNETIFPGRYIHIILKIPVGTATASQIIRGTCSIEGYFE